MEASEKPNSGIVFANTDIFGKGFTHTSKNDGSIVTKLLSLGVLQFNGLLDKSMLDLIDKKMVWLYLRYIWVSNLEKPDMAGAFAGMSSTSTATVASAFGFVTSVCKFLGYEGEIKEEKAASITVENLVDYVNSLITSHQHIEIPILTNLMKLVMEKIGQDMNSDTEQVPETSAETLVPVPNVSSKIDQGILSVKVKI